MRDFRFAFVALGLSALITAALAGPQKVEPQLVPPGTQVKQIHVTLGEAGVTSLGSSGVLWNHAWFGDLIPEGMVWYFPTDWEVDEDVALADTACLNRFRFAYYGTNDVNGDGLIDVALTLYNWDGSTCGAPSGIIGSFTINDLPVDPDFAFIVDVDFDSKVVLPQYFYFGIRFVDDGQPSFDVGWLLADGSGNARCQGKDDFFLSNGGDGCWYFGGDIDANFYLKLFGSHNVVFHVMSDMAKQAGTLDTLRVYFNDERFLKEFIQGCRYELADLDQDGFPVFTVPLAGGSNTIQVDTQPFLVRKFDFNVFSSDPCRPDIVHVDLTKGDLDGDNVIADTDLRRVLLNFGKTGDPKD